MLKVLVIVDAKLETPPRYYGGTERVAALLCEGLAARGHEVTLMARRGSSANVARLRTYSYAGRRPRLLRAFIRAGFLARFHSELRRRPDVVVSFGRPDYLRTLAYDPVPLVYRFANPIQLSEYEDLKRHIPGGLRIVGISRSHVAVLPHDAPVQVVYNGVDVGRLPVGNGSSDYIAFLGRLTHNKGVDAAIRIARRAGVRLKIAGNISDAPGDKEYFEAQIRPQLGDGIEWIGPVDDAQKVELLGGALALLNPIRWEEPFGIVVAEALACGTPVIATPYGSMPELVRDGINGFLGADEDALVEAVRRVSAVSRSACRADAEARFSQSAMTDGYLAVISGLLAEVRARQTTRTAS